MSVSVICHLPRQYCDRPCISGIFDSFHFREVERMLWCNCYSLPGTFKWWLRQREGHEGILYAWLLVVTLSIPAPSSTSPINASRRQSFVSEAELTWTRPYISLKSFTCREHGKMLVKTVAVCFFGVVALAFVLVQGKRKYLPGHCLSFVISGNVTNSRRDLLEKNAFTCKVNSQLPSAT